MIIINKMPPAQDLKAIIFDFDGLMLESEEPDYQSWREIYEQHGVVLALDEWLPLIGTGASTNTFDPYARLESLLGHAIDRELIQRIRRQRYLELVEASPLLPGVMETITLAQQLGLKLAVASSGTRAWVTGHLTRRALMENFTCVVCGDEVEYAKPHPDVYLRALENLSVQPEQAIALEDSPNGVRAARAAGIFCIAIPGPMTRHCAFDHASLQLLSLTELLLEMQE